MGSAASPRKVLFVEDESALRSTYQRFFASRYELAFATSGTEALRLLEDLSFLLPPGQTLAVFGPNGAGKTTLLKVLAGLIRPQAGTTHVEGGPGAIGWMGHQAHLYGHLTVRENLLFWAALYDVPTPLRRARVDEALRPHWLAGPAGEAGRAASRGPVQRAGIARALPHEPRGLLLGQPFTGLGLAAAGHVP